MKQNKRLEEDFKAWLKWNCSTMFLMKPIVGLGIGDLVEFGLVNAYLKDEGKDDASGEFLHILFKPKRIEILQIFITLQEADNDNYVEDYDYEGGWVVIKYSIPSIYKADFELFKKGEYSKLSPHFKNKHAFKVVINSKEQPSFQYMVFYKDEKLKKDIEEYFEMKLGPNDELWQIPGEGEILNIEKLKAKENERIANSSKEVGGAPVTKRFMFHRAGDA